MATLEGTPLKTEKEIEKHIKDQDLENGIKDNKFLTAWNEKDNQGNNLILQQMSSNELSTCEEHIRKRTLQCRSQTIMTESRRYMMGFTNSPMCTMCIDHVKEPLRDTVQHRLSGCKNPQISKMYTLRHNELERTCIKAIIKGYNGKYQVNSRISPIAKEFLQEPTLLVDAGIDPEGELK